MTFFTPGIFRRKLVDDKGNISSAGALVASTGAGIVGARYV